MVANQSVWYILVIILNASGEQTGEFVVKDDVTYLMTYKECRERLPSVIDSMKHIPSKEGETFMVDCEMVCRGR